MLNIGTHFSKLPGRVDNPELYVVRFGNTRTYMYMTEGKWQETNRLVAAVNSKAITLVADVYENPRTTEFSAIASIRPNPVLIDDSVDESGDKSSGQGPLNDYAKRIQAIAEKTLHIGPLFAVSREINLIVSHDAHTFHKDSFPKQYAYLAKHPELPRCSLIHDLTLVDWDMAKGTVSGTIFHDPVGGDRFLLALLPGDQFGTFSIEPIEYQEDGRPPEDPGAQLLPFHAVLSSEDLRGDVTAGSSKGQRISSVLRGLVQDEDAKAVDAHAKELPVSRPSLEADGSISYPNGMHFKKVITKTREAEAVVQLEERENVQKVTYKTVDSQECHHELGVDATLHLQSHVRLSKKDGGFNVLSSLHPVEEGDHIVIVNRSELPSGYKQYCLSEDQSDLGLPWIQMYQFPAERALHLTKQQYDRLLLTPVLELLYRDEATDCGKERAPCSKLATHLDVYVFSCSSQRKNESGTGRGTGL